CGGDRLGQHPLELAERGFDLVCKLQRIGTGLLLNGQDDGRLAHVAGVAALYARGVVYRGELPQLDRNALSVRHGEVSQVLQPIGAPDIPDEVFPGVLVHETAGCVGPELPERGLDLVAGNIETGHLRQIERHAILPHLAADRDHLGNTRDGEEAWAHDPVDHLPDLHRARLIAANGDKHDFPHDGGDGRHLGVDVARQLLPHDAQAFGDLLTIEVDVRSPVELDVEDRQANPRYGAHPYDTRHAVHGSLKRKCYELLDLFGGKAFGLGHQCHHRTVEVGEDVDGQVAQGERPISEQNERRGQYEQTVPQAGCNEEVEHWRRPGALADLIEQGGAFGDHAQIGLEARQHDNTLSIQGLVP